MSKLESIGFSDWFQSKVDAEKANTHKIARIVSVHKDSYIVTNGLKEVFC
jgi:ribosome biogenesis GTPase